MKTIDSDYENDEEPHVTHKVSAHADISYFVEGEGWTDTHVLPSDTLKVQSPDMGGAMQMIREELERLSARAISSRFPQHVPTEPSTSGDVDVSLYHDADEHGDMRESLSGRYYLQGEVDCEYLDNNPILDVDFNVVVEKPADCLNDALEDLSDTPECAEGIAEAKALAAQLRELAKSVSGGLICVREALDRGNIEGARSHVEDVASDAHKLAASVSEDLLKGANQDTYLPGKLDDLLDDDE